MIGGDSWDLGKRRSSENSTSHLQGDYNNFLFFPSNQGNGKLKKAPHGLLRVNDVSGFVKRTKCLCTLISILRPVASYCDDRNHMQAPSRHLTIHFHFKGRLNDDSAIQRFSVLTYIREQKSVGDHKSIMYILRITLFRYNFQSTDTMIGTSCSQKVQNMWIFDIFEYYWWNV